METINERVALLRKELRLTQEEFGERVGIKKSAVSKLENGTNNVTDSLVKFMIREFHVNGVWLQYGEGEMFSSALDEDRIDAIFSKSDPIVRAWMKALVKLPDEDWERFKEELSKVEAIRNGEA